MAFDLSLSALLGDNIYNFGELLAHPIVSQSSTDLFLGICLAVLGGRSVFFDFVKNKKKWNFTLGWYIQRFSFLSYVIILNAFICSIGSLLASLYLDRSLSWFCRMDSQYRDFHCNLPCLLIHLSSWLADRSIVSLGQKWSGSTIFFRLLTLEIWLDIKNYVRSIMQHWLLSLL